MVDRRVGTLTEEDVHDLATKVVLEHGIVSRSVLVFARRLVSLSSEQSLEGRHEEARFRGRDLDQL